MASKAFNKTALALGKPFGSVEGFCALNKRWLSNLGGPYDRRSTKESEDERRRRGLDDPLASSWVPHPRSGIFVPKGQEWVVDDVPREAASFDRTFWFRNIDGDDHD